MATKSKRPLSPKEIEAKIAEAIAAIQKLTKKQRGR